VVSPSQQILFVNSLTDYLHYLMVMTKLVCAPLCSVLFLL
jgi:hypothetical protein